MTQWELRRVPLKFQLGDWTLCSVSLSLQARSAGLFATLPTWLPARSELMAGSHGFLVRAMPIAETLPTISWVGDYLRYVALRYQHCYIDLGQSFDSYKSKFSSKTRSSIGRKVRKYADHCRGAVVWKAYTRPEQMPEFFRLASAVSKRTYQERLLDAGLPTSEDFVRHAEAMAANDRLRAYLLFDGQRPVSYLYCPADNDVLVYAYLGYDPEYAKLSVGTVLQWIALEHLFSESKFRWFDFTEGQSAHKMLFATHQRLCANVFLLRPSPANRLLVRCHEGTNRFSAWLGLILERAGLKARVRRLLRSTG